MIVPDISHLYEVLRTKNPWLPPADFVSGKPGMSLELGIDKIPTLHLQVYVELPDMVVGNEVHSWGPAPDEEAPEEKPQEMTTDEVW
jgi:hypothetical protein